MTAVRTAARHERAGVAVAERVPAEPLALPVGGHGAICSSTAAGPRRRRASPRRAHRRAARSARRGAARRSARRAGARVSNPSTAITGRGRVPPACRGRARARPARRRLRARSPAAPAGFDLERGDRAVRRVVLAAGRVGVDPRDRLVERRAARGCARRRARWSAAPGRASTAGRRAQAAEHAAAAVERASAPFATQGVVAGPIRTRPTATSSHASGAPSKPIPCSQSQRSACCEPQLCPIIPGQRSSSSRRPSASTRARERALPARGSRASCAGAARRRAAGGGGGAAVAPRRRRSGPRRRVRAGGRAAADGARPEARAGDLGQSPATRRRASP